MGNKIARNTEVYNLLIVQKQDISTENIPKDFTEIDTQNMWDYFMDKLKVMEYI